MRRLPYIIAGIFVFLIAGYSVFWYLQAQRAKELFVDIATHLPDHPNANGKIFTLKYDDIHVGGYPFSYRVIFKNPVLSWKTPLPGDMVGFKDAKSDLAPMDTMKLTGELALESNYLANSFAASSTGIVDSTMETPDGPLSWQSHWDGPSTFSIAFNEEGRKKLMAGENPFALLQNPQELVRSLHAISFAGTNVSIKRMPDGKQIFFVPSNSIDFSLNPIDATNSEIKLKVDTKDMVLTHEYGMLLAGFYMIGGVDKAAIPTYRQFDERAGKTTIAIDVSATGPFQPDAAPPAEYNLDVESRQFSIKNDWYEITLPMMLKIKRNATTNSFSLTHEGVIRFSKEMEQALREDYITSGRAYAELQQLFQDRGVSTPPPYQIDSSGIFPEISSFGMIKTAADISSSDDGKALDIKKASIHSDLYSVDATGNVKFTDSSANIKVDCTNCLQMIDDAAAYYNHTQNFMRQINPQSKFSMLSTTQIDAVKQMITSLDADPASKDVITFNYQQQGGTSTISGQPIQQVMLQAMMIMSSPAAGKPADPSAVPAPDAAAPTAPATPPAAK